MSCTVSSLITLNCIFISMHLSIGAQAGRKWGASGALNFDDLYFRVYASLLQITCSLCNSNFQISQCFNVVGAQNKSDSNLNRKAFTHGKHFDRLATVQTRADSHHPGRLVWHLCRRWIQGELALVNGHWWCRAVFDAHHARIVQCEAGDW